MNCLENLVGLRNVCSSETNLLYIDDLPMIDVVMAGDTARDSDINAKNFFERIRRLAARQVSRDFVYRYHKDIQFNSAYATKVLGSYKSIDQPTFLSSSAEYLATEISGVGYDPFMKMRIDKLEIYTTTTGEQTITVFDGTSYTEFVHTFVAGTNEIDIDLSGLFFRIYLDNTSFELGEMGGGCGCAESVGCSICNSRKNLKMSTDSDPRVDAWEPSNILPFKVYYKLLCDKEMFLCQYAEELADALRWKIASIMMNEIIVSNRTNPVVRNSVDEAEYIKTIIEGGINPRTGFRLEKKDAEYWRELFSVQKSINKSIKESKCVECRGLRYIESL